MFHQYFFVRFSFLFLPLLPIILISSSLSYLTYHGMVARPKKAALIRCLFGLFFWFIFFSLNFLNLGSQIKDYSCRELADFVETLVSYATSSVIRLFSCSESRLKLWVVCTAGETESKSDKRACIFDHASFPVCLSILFFYLHFLSVKSKTGALLVPL